MWMGQFPGFFRGFTDLQYASVLFDDEGFKELWLEAQAGPALIP